MNSRKACLPDLHDESDHPSRGWFRGKEAGSPFYGSRITNLILVAEVVTLWPSPCFMESLTWGQVWMLAIGLAEARGLVRGFLV